VTQESGDAPAARIAQRLNDLIREAGPLPVSGFMATALFDPAYGYYATRDPIGAGADFITAPEISQMFGEVIGLWLAEAWRLMGEPPRVQLIELGPGKGTLMTDILRTGRAMPGFLDAVEITLVEASPALKMVQGRTLAASPVPVRFADRLEQAPAGPSLVIGNEFLDCLPFRQAVKHDGVWRERCVALSEDEPKRFVFVLGAPLDPAQEPFPPELVDAPDGALVELRPADRQIVDTLAERFHRDPGCALLIDYGPEKSEAGDTLQALQRHEKVDPLAEPGTADLTAHVDFAMLKAFASDAGLAVSGPAPQRDFLLGLGAGARAEALSRAAPAKAERLARQLHRLTAPEEMGVLFKVIALSSGDLGALPGFSGS